jgi:hypothetical protein
MTLIYEMEKTGAVATPILANAVEKLSIVEELRAVVRTLTPKWRLRGC